MKKSGHWDKFKDELFRIITREGHEFAMKPMTVRITSRYSTAGSGAIRSCRKDIATLLPATGTSRRENFQDFHVYEA